MAKRKKQISNKAKAGIGFFLVGALAVQTIKRIFFNTKWKRAVFYTTVGSLFLYNSCGDDIEKFSKDSYTKVYEIFNNPVQEENDLLKKEIDSLSTLVKKEEIQYKKSTVKKVENRKMPPLKVYTEPYVNPNEIQYWHPVKKGETLSEIAYDYLGDRGLFKEISKLNNISNSSDVEVGFPLKLPSHLIKNYKGLRKDRIPENLSIMKNGESIKKHLSYLVEDKSDLDDITREVHSYNHEKGNKIPLSGYKNLREVIVYLPNDLR